MTHKYAIACGDKKTTIDGRCFQDAAWKFMFKNGWLKSLPMRITEVESNRSLDVIGDCPKCNTEVWLDDDWVVMQRTGRFGHRDCYNPGGFAYSEMTRGGGTVDIPF